MELPTLLRRGLVGFGDEGSAWVAQLPDRIDRLRRRWDLDLGPPFEPGGVTSWVAPAGADAVLKIVVPHEEAAPEADALRDWGGEGAVRLVDAAPEEHALLLERCRPGTALSGSGLPDEEVLDVAATTAARLWRTAPAGAPYADLGVVTASWADLVEERVTTIAVPLDAVLVTEGASLLRALSASAGRSVLLHGDLHPANLLAAEREPWLAIDPKPMRGDPAYDLPPLVLQTGHLLEHRDPGLELDRRLDRVAAATGIDAERIRGWGIARAVEMAVWSVAKGDPDGPQEAAAWARLLAYGA